MVHAGPSEMVAKSATSNLAAPLGDLMLPSIANGQVLVRAGRKVARSPGAGDAGEIVVVCAGQ